jgi:hypothetical protein
MCSARISHTTGEYVNCASITGTPLRPIDRQKRKTKTPTEWAKRSLLALPMSMRCAQRDRDQQTSEREYEKLRLSTP